MFENCLLFDKNTRTSSTKITEIEFYYCDLLLAVLSRAEIATKFEFHSKCPDSIY